MLEDGSWVSERFYQLSEILQDYDKNLELRWIPPDKRETKFEKANPYVIVDTRTETIVKYVSERDEPHLVLAEIFGMDNIHNDPIRRLADQNAAIATFKLKEKIDHSEALRDEMNFLFGNQKSRIKHNGVWYDDEMRRL